MKKIKSIVSLALIITLICASSGCNQNNDGQTKLNITNKESLMLKDWERYFEVSKDTTIIGNLTLLYRESALTERGRIMYSFKVLVVNEEPYDIIISKESKFIDTNLQEVFSTEPFNLKKYQITGFFINIKSEKNKVESDVNNQTDTIYTNNSLPYITANRVLFDRETLYTNKAKLFFVKSIELNIQPN